MEITCFRGSETSRESRSLPASTYNLAITMLARSTSGHLFVPIRSMQYLAIVDKAEFVFIDGERKCWIDIAWQNFQSHTRTSLDQPVTYEAVFYRENQAMVMSRLQKEFHVALRALANKETLNSPARIIKYPKHGS